jgi:cation diffusion facilitator CzcD-associated flavoprotein CzcO
VRGAETEYDVVVVGAGLGGLYAVHRFLKQGLRVVALEAAPSVGGVWFHNKYPGARVDVESIDYCYFFSPEIFRAWRWSERYASQKELLAYLNFVADHLDLRPHIRLSTPMTSARWRPREACYEIVAGENKVISASFLVMATGNLSEPRPTDVLPGLDKFRGEWVRTSRWPDRPVATKDRRIAVVGTGSSGVQAIPELAASAAHLYVFQRTANYVVPAQNGPLDDAAFDALAADIEAARARLFRQRAGTTPTLDPPKPAAQYTPEERTARLEAQWRAGGQGMNGVFADQGIDESVNNIVAEFVRGKVRSIVKDPALAETLCATSYPIGSRRLIMDNGYYETFNRDNVTLVNVAESPIEEVTETGIRTRDGFYEVDLIVLALGFQAFRGAIEKVDIRNAQGDTPTTSWGRGPQTLLGLMTAGFPNLFILTGPGSPSVLANMFLINEFHVDWVADCIAYMDASGFATIEPEIEAQERWTEHVVAVAQRLLRLRVNNYMVHVNADGSRVFMPYTGGLDAYVTKANEIAARGYEGFRLTRLPAKADALNG